MSRGCPWSSHSKSIVETSSSPLQPSSRNTLFEGTNPIYYDLKRQAPLRYWSEGRLKINLWAQKPTNLSTTFMKCLNFSWGRKTSIGQKRRDVKAFHYNRIALDNFPSTNLIGHRKACTESLGFPNISLRLVEDASPVLKWGYLDLSTLISLLAFKELVNNSLTNKGKTRYTMMFVLTGMTSLG